MEGSVDLGLAGTGKPIKGNPGVGHSGRPSALRRRLLFCLIVAATAAVLCTLGLSAVAGTAARAADAPTVTSVSPSEGVATGGIRVTITGSGFTGATAVVFGSTDEAFTVVSDTEITAVESAQPVGTVVDVTVVTPDGTSAVTPADQFTFVPGTEITGISPAAGSIDGGNTITITGTGFLPGAQVSVDLNANQFGFHQHLAAGTADSHGNFTTTVTLPINLQKGSYQLQAAGIGSDANVRLLSSDLNFTGHGIAGVSSSHARWLVDAGIGLVVAAMVLFVAARRRRHKAGQAS